VHPHAVTYVVALDHTSLHKRWALAPPRVPRSRTSPPWRGELRCYNVSHGPGPHLHAEASSGAVMCPSAPNFAYLLR
jgi:hypothetical protein